MTLAAPATAQLLDPATLHVGDTAADVLTAAKEPNIIPGGNEFFLGQESGQTSPSPTELIFAVPDYTGMTATTAPTISKVLLNDLGSALTVESVVNVSTESGGRGSSPLGSSTTYSA
jgi:hypothetical protein